MNRIIAIVLLLCSVALTQTNTSKPQTNQKPTSADAEKFVTDAERQLFDLGIKAQRAGWVQENFITDDTEQMAADINDQLTELATRLAKEAVHFDGLALPYDTTRKLQLIKLALTLPAPSNDATGGHQARSQDGRRVWSRQVLSRGRKERRRSAEVLHAE
jgi:peptidyl-dipeptidase A